jgi:hypothetical protein
MNLDDIHSLMATQHGAASTSQVRQTLTWERQQTLLGRRIWRTPSVRLRDNRVVISRGSPATWQQRVMVATLATRGVASHGTAARLHGLDGFSRCDAVHITLRYAQNRRYHEGATTHISRIVDAADQLPIEGIPTIILPICLLQLAEGGADPMLKALDGALRDGVSPTWIRQVATRFDRPGSAAANRLLRPVDERVDGTLPLSWFQRLACRVLAEAGIAMVDEFPIHDGNRLLATLDLAIPELRIGVECQSWKWHATPRAQQHDAARKRALRRLGWDISDLWWSDIDRIDDVVATIMVVAAERRPNSV